MKVVDQGKDFFWFGFDDSRALHIKRAGPGGCEDENRHDHNCDADNNFEDQ
jgi:hypothetical protein